MFVFITTSISIIDVLLSRILIRNISAHIDEIVVYPYAKQENQKEYISTRITNNSFSGLSHFFLLENIYLQGMRQ